MIEKYFIEHELENIRKKIKNMPMKKRKKYLERIASFYLMELDEFCPHVDSCEYWDIKVCHDKYKACPFYEMMEEEE